MDAVATEAVDLSDKAETESGESNFLKELQSHFKTKETRFLVWDAILKTGLMDKIADVPAELPISEEKIDQVLQIYYPENDKKKKEEARGKIKKAQTASLPGLLTSYVADEESRRQIGNIIVRGELIEQANNLYLNRCKAKNIPPTEAPVAVFMKQYLAKIGKLTILNCGTLAENNYSNKQIESGRVDDLPVTLEDLASEEFMETIISDMRTVYSSKQGIPKGVRLICKKADHARMSGYASNFSAEEFPPPDKNAHKSDYLRLQNVAEQMVRGILSDGQTILIRYFQGDSPIISCLDYYGRGIKLEWEGKWMMKGFIDSVSLYDRIQE